MPTPISTSKRSAGGRAPTASNLKTKSTPNLNEEFSTSSRPPLPPLPSTHLETQDTTKTGGTPRRKSSGPPSRLSQSKTLHDPDAGGKVPVMYAARSAATRNVVEERNGNQNLEVGDTVDVPGGMHGTIRFIGEVKGKKGIFAGVELSKEWAARGKNDGDVDGIKYFSTSIRGAGIFLPSNKAYKRLSPPNSNPTTPLTTSLAPFNQGGRADPVASAMPSLTSKLNQSVGPGRGGARSPEFKASSRPSLPRPESPSRRAPYSSSTPANRTSLGNPKLSKSMIGAPRYAPSPTPGRFGASISGASKSQIGDPGKRNPQTPKSNLKKGPNGAGTLEADYRNESRNGSHLGPEPLFDSESDNTPIGAAKISALAKVAQTRSRPVSTQNEELRQLRSELADRDRQLQKQAADIEEMQNSVNELQTNPTINNSNTTRSSRGSGVDDMDATSLRALLREKSEKIKQLTEEFDSHRADFRDTIDILEHTSDETNRLHQEKIDSLQNELRGMQERIDRGEDMDAVAQTLKQLDEQVQELEEGLEDARRGEAEARGEVEYLRGEVERTRTELDREKQKSAAKAAQGANDAFPNHVDLMRELKRRDDEIKGLRAIIHSLNQSEASEKGSPRSSRRISKQRNSGPSNINGHDSEAYIAEERQAREKAEIRNKELEDLVDRKTFREEELENEIQRLRKAAAHVSASSNGHSERTAQPGSKHHNQHGSNASVEWESRTSPTSPFQPPPFPRSNPSSNSRPHVNPTPESDSHSTTMTESSNLWCDLCDTAGHDILSCTNMGASTSKSKDIRPPSSHARKAQYTSPRVQSHDREEDYSLDHNLNENHYRYPSHQHPVSHFSTSSPSITAPVSTIPEHSAMDITPKPAPPLQAPAVPTPMPNPMDTGLVAGKLSGIADGSKWCAICERDGHDATDCPFEGQF